MNLSQRLRTCAKHTGLDAVIELLQEAADEIDALQARAQVTPEPVGFTYQAEIEYADSTGGNGSFWRVPPDLDDEAVPLYTHPAPSAPGDVVLDAKRYRWLCEDHADPETRARCREILERLPVMGYGAAVQLIDDAMLAAKEASA